MAAIEESINNNTGRITGDEENIALNKVDIATNEDSITVNKKMLLKIKQK